MTGPAVRAIRVQEGRLMMDLLALRIQDRVGRVTAVREVLAILVRAERGKIALRYVGDD